MDARQTSEQATAPVTTTDRRSDREVVVTRTFNAPARIVFEAWTTPELIMKWWTPASFGITFISCEADVRTGGNYRFVMGHPSFDQPMAFFGKYIEVVPNKRIVWTNEEGDGSVTTVTFEEKDGKTHLVLSDVYPDKAALDEAMASGGIGGFPEQFNQLDTLLKSSN
ncbi:MAG: SRPBCC family protein [Devosia sp.]